MPSSTTPGSALRAEVVNKFSAEMLVFCDESGVERPGSPLRTGWTLKGDVPKKSSELSKLLRFHLVPALSTSGLLDVTVYKGQPPPRDFLTWLSSSLLPRTNTFPGPNSVLVMDYVTWHRSPGVAALCRDRGVLVLYFPPCSGDFNPIEPYFED